MSDQNVQNPIKDLAMYIMSRHAGVWITSYDERRVESSIIRLAGKLRDDLKVFLWSCASGMVDSSSDERSRWTGGSSWLSPMQAIKGIIDWKGSGIFVLRDFHPFVVGGNPANVPIIRALRELMRMLKDGTTQGKQPSGEPPLKTVIFLSPEVQLPSDLLTELVLMRWPLPDADEIGKALDAILRSRKAKAEASGEAVEDIGSVERNLAVQAARGLSMQETDNGFALSIVSTGTISASVVSAAKKQAVARSGALTWIDPPADGLQLVGGLEVLKSWLRTRKLAFSPEAQTYGLPCPKGALFIGIPGSGKSLVVKCLGAEWQMPVLGLSADQISGSLLGESEGKMRRVMEMAEASAPCILALN